MTAHATWAFFYEGRVHVFQHPNNPNGRYDLQSDSTFNFIMDENVDSVKTLVIYIPITKKQKAKFVSVCESYIAKIAENNMTK